MTLRDAYIAKLEEENDELRERVRMLQDQLGMAFEAPPQFLLTRAETVIFGLLLKNSLVRKEMAMSAIYAHLPDEEPEIKIVDVWVCKMRRKLRPYGIEIQTQWGQGYFISAEGKRAARRLLEESNGCASAMELSA